MTLLCQIGKNQMQPWVKWYTGQQTVEFKTHFWPGNDTSQVLREGEKNTWAADTSIGSLNTTHLTHSARGGVVSEPS